jgi:hypothetical protein
VTGQVGKARGRRVVRVRVRVGYLVVSCKHFFQLAAAKAISSSEDAAGAPSGSALLPVWGGRRENGERERGRDSRRRE